MKHKSQTKSLRTLFNCPILAHWKRIGMGVGQTSCLYSPQVPEHLTDKTNILQQGNWWPTFIILNTFSESVITSGDWFLGPHQNCVSQ